MTPRTLPAAPRFVLGFALTALTSLAALAICAALTSCASPKESYRGEVSAAHGHMDQAQGAEEKAAALSHVEKTFERRSPGPLENEVRADLAGRAARAHLELGRASDALIWTDRGLSLTQDPSPGSAVLRASLLITEADALIALGRPDQARARLMAAVRVNQSLLAQELQNP